MAIVRHRTSDDGRPSWLDWGPPAWLPHFDDLFKDPDGKQLIRLDEFEQAGDFVVRAEMPGLDPEKDVEISVEAGLLTIRAERTQEEETSKKHFHRKEIQYGGFSRTVPLPEGTNPSDIKASYKDGILEIRVPVPEAAKEQATKVPVSRG